MGGYSIKKFPKKGVRIGGVLRWMTPGDVTIDYQGPRPNRPRPHVNRGGVTLNPGRVGSVRDNPQVSKGDVSEVLRGSSRSQGAFTVVFSSSGGLKVLVRPSRYTSIRGGKRRKRWREGVGRRSALTSTLRPTEGRGLLLGRNS